MQEQIILNNKPLTVNFSDSALAWIATQEQPIMLEMELYFSCLIRKKVVIYDQIAEDALRVKNNLFIRFHPIMTEKCNNDFNGDEPPTTDFPIVNKTQFTPHWLNVDTDDDRLVGEFGF